MEENNPCEVCQIDCPNREDEDTRCGFRGWADPSVETSSTLTIEVKNHPRTPSGLVIGAIRAILEGKFETSEW